MADAFVGRDQRGVHWLPREEPLKTTAGAQSSEFAL
jgi:hypothetical protein